MMCAMVRDMTATGPMDTSFEVAKNCDMEALSHSRVEK